MSKVFLITGAASGIGLALSHRLLENSHQVCVCDINFESLHNLYKSYSSKQILIQKLDVRDFDNWQKTINQVLMKWNKLDVLCNVAGVLKENWVIDSSPQEVDLHFDINLKGTILGTQSVLQTMKAQGSGHIINIASLAALSPVPGLSLYSASKFAVRSYSIAAGMELAELGISVTAICPDAVQTPMLDQQKDKVQAALTFSGPRALTVDEVVDAIVNVALVKKPLEIILPQMRGILAKLANSFPSVAATQMNTWRRKGIKQQLQEKK
ncbi:SDR family NAD(P)-dependent oxidoreductase [Acinetobacter modestus]|uniref:SDR family oxidoreductase n=1 Tax=Acinetobacter modestus TaxID=1776740 RepID=A0ABN0JNC3_9GAMM|nr:SDR family oxidoreductase [Acinetobacter modestus]ENU26805.1 hypothetical protein F992_02354 [Acinetobacter modestus]GGA11582.1 3-oxoacyl-ACP reductase [Acinetobacter modestus]